MNDIRNEKNMEILTGTFYELSEETADRLPTILSGGNIELSSPLTLEFKPMDCYMLLYTRQGSGCVRLRTRTLSLEENRLLYLDCHSSPFCIEPTHFPWRYTIFLVQGDLFADYNDLAPFSSALLHTPSAHSPILRCMEQLLKAGTGSSLYNKLSDAAILTNLMTNLWIEAYELQPDKENCAPYLSEIRHYLDTAFMESFRLEDLEMRYHMSKYRICHEFSSAFGLPPLKYLNKKRLEAAVNLLFSTDKRIHEIALEVGYENTNHFINLFKKEYGATPQAYREAHHF